MIPNSVQNTFSYLDETQICLVKANTTEMLKEKRKSGKAELQVTVTNDAIVVKNPEKKTLPYLNEKTGSKRCCDKFIFSFDKKAEKACTLHLIEFKKSVDVSIINNDLREQFLMGILNAKALAGFLDIEINDIKIYVAFRRFTSPPIAIAMRGANSNKAMKCYNAWKSGELPLEMPWGTTVYKNVQVQLDENGNGSLVI